ncbi:retrotransposon protein, putative, ty1-copia subclass [Tanacetum coccineum]
MMTTSSPRAPKIPPSPKRDNLAKDSVCHHYKEVGYWRRNCLSYHVELKKRKNASIASTSCIFTIELYAFPHKTWVYDTGCGTHICNTLQGLKGSMKLKHGALSLYVGNGMHATIEAIGSFDLVLPSGLIIILDNCHFVPTITRGVVLISGLVNNGYIHIFTNYGISVSKDNVFYFNAIPRDGIYEIDMHNLYPNDSSMYNVSNKRSKYALDSSYLWHCHLGHINKKHMDKLQRDGILQPTHDESLEKCKSCISGNMACKPFPHQVERAKDLLGLIHTDVCGPFRTVSREGASYFITFTNDFSRYGYVYLMKHKHEVFETFKVFQNEAENQLDKKIKVIRFDRGGEYLSYEFVNHMKSYGIVSQLTSPYTPQHNGVSEKRNRTLLDMVRSMMNLTTMPNPFWGYALESAARILNMVLTNKVERTPYEIWHGKALKLSYLRDTQRKRWVTTSTIQLRTRFLLLKMLSSLRIILRYKKRMGVMDFSKRVEVLIPQAPDRYGFYVDVEEYKLGDLNELPNYNAALSDPESDKWLEAMNTEIQSMKDNQVWVLVDLPPNGQTVMSSIMYAVRCTRPDVAFAQNLCSRFQQNPGEIYWTVVKTILRTIPNPKQGMCSYLMVEPWTGRVPSKASMEVVWMRKFIDGLGGVVPSNKRPMKMLCDNEPAIAIANDLGILKGAKHFQRKYHYIREVIQEREIVLKKVHTDDNVADPFTKPTPYNKHYEHAMTIGICPASSLM